MTAYDLVGYIGTFLITLSLTPQLCKSLKTRSTHDISLAWTSVYMAGLFVWVIYAILNLIWPAIVFSTVEFLLATALFILKLIYK